MSGAIKWNSDSLKAVAVSWLRFKRQLDIVCTEDPIRHADAIGTCYSNDCKKMIEIECKISISDLKNDIHKTHTSAYLMPKHIRMSKAINKETAQVDCATLLSKYAINAMNKEKDPLLKCAVHGTGWDNNTETTLPSQFYFLVPAIIQEEALSVITELYPHAGLMIPHRRPTHDYIHVIKTAPRIHGRFISQRFKNQLINRMSSEIAGLRKDMMIRYHYG